MNKRNIKIKMISEEFTKPKENKDVDTEKKNVENNRQTNPPTHLMPFDTSVVQKVCETQRTAWPGHSSAHSSRGFVVYASMHDLTTLARRRGIKNGPCICFIVNSSSFRFNFFFRLFFCSPFSLSFHLFLSFSSLSLSFHLYLSFYSLSLSFHLYLSFYFLSFLITSFPSHRFPFLPKP